MTNQNDTMIGALIRSIADYEADQISLEDIQGRLQSALGNLERDQSGAWKAIHLCEADLEEIRFASLKTTHRKAALVTLGHLRAILSENR
jgi:hypothetical protein